MKVAIVALSGCDGCQYNLVSKEFADLLERDGISLTYWPLAGIGKEVDDVDVALVEGSVLSGRDLELLHRVRSRAKVLVALGSCACLGGVQGALGLSKPVSSHVKVDYYVRGCPAQPSEVIELIKKIAAGLKWIVSEKRFSYVERGGRVIEDELMKFDQLKCFVCGRCVEICSKIGAKVLNYVNRGIETLVSTPYGEPFRKSGCVYCGLCAAYCPAGAITYSLDVDKVLTEIRRGHVFEAYVEPEVIASLSEAEGLDPLKVICGLKAIGFKRVTVYDPLADIDLRTEGVIVARSLAEKKILQALAPGVKAIEPKLNVPPGVVYITQCLSWKRVLPKVLTAREAQIALKKLNYDTLTDEYPDYVVLRQSEVTKVDPLAVHAGFRNEKSLPVFEVCPGGCLMGGGQPLSSNKKRFSAILQERATKLSDVRRMFKVC